MGKKKIIVGVGLVVGLGVSVYLWSTVGMGEDQGDQTVAEKSLTYTCQKCNNTFTMTVAEAGATRRANEGQIVCPSCGEAGAQKHDVQVVVSGDGGFKREEEEKPAEQPENVEPAKPKISTGGRQKIP